jgi:type VI secretion system protein VasG
MNRERLFARLGPTAYSALVDATALGRARKHAFVDLDHWALCLLKRERCDLVLLLSELGFDLAAVTRRLEVALSRVSASGDSLRDISPVLERSVGPAITWSQIAAPAEQVRSGHLFLAWLDDPATFRWLSQLDPHALEGITLDDAVKRYEALHQRWPEAVEAPAIASAGGAALPGLADADAGEALARWGSCMTDQAARGELDPVVARGDELRAVTDILLRRRQNNPILVGEAGVGKTAIVEGLAQQIHAGHVPPSLAQAQVWALDVTRMQAGASARGEFEQRLRSVMDAVVASPRPIILFCDEAHTLIGAGGAAGTGDAVNLIKPMLARGQLRLVAATTWSEYKQFIEPDAALVRRFQAVPVEEPSDAAALDMLRMIAPRFARHHGVQIADGALQAAVCQSRRHLPARQLPDKAISLLDTACARVAMSQSCAPAELDRLAHEVRAVEQALEWRASDRRLGLPVPEDHDLCARRAELKSRADRVSHGVTAERDDVRAWLEQFHGAEAGSPGAWTAGRPVWVQPWVDEQSISQVLSEWTGVPCAQLAQDDAGRLVALGAELEARIHGQQGALAALTQAVQVSRSGLGEPQRPLGVMLLAGPTGSGKSQTAVALAQLLFGGERQLIQFNMNEFQESHTVSTLKGAPPGYVGFGKGGRLTEAIRKKPYSVLLLDEFDRAHADIHEIFYQAFDQGWMEDGEGRRVSFRNCLILLTSNLGDAEISAALLANPELSQARLDALARECYLRKFSPALLARMQVVAYRPLDALALEGIAVQALTELGRRLEANDIAWHVAGDVPAWIANAVSRHPAGGRAVRDLLRQQVVPRIAQGALVAQAANRPIRAVTLSAERGLALAFDDRTHEPMPTAESEAPAASDAKKETPCA